MLCRRVVTALRPLRAVSARALLCSTPVLSRHRLPLRSLASSHKNGPENYGGPHVGYRNTLQAAILDWSGTCADNYVIAPAAAFVEVFEKHKVPITMAEARGPMGLRKDLHIKALTEMPAIRDRWTRTHGKAPTQANVDAMFADFVPMQLKCLPLYTGLIPGTVEAVNTLRRDHGLLIGNTTGFQRVMVDVLLAAAKKQGYVPDVSVAGDEVHQPRPWPNMLWRNLQLLNVKPVHAVVKVDDTVGGVQEGLNAGTWAVGLYETSNYMDIDSLEHRAAMSPAEFARRAAISKKILEATGAHYVIPDIRSLPSVVVDINRRLMAGDRP